MNEQKPILAPSKTFIAKAIQTSDGFHAVFSAPGLVPRKVGRDGHPFAFDSEKEAENAALRALFGALNAPRETQGRGRDTRYRKLTGPEFAVLLAESKIGLTLFAHIYGTFPDRVQSWIDGTNDVPHPARVLLEIFKAHPKTVDTAERVTEAVATERKPR